MSLKKVTCSDLGMCGLCRGIVGDLFHSRMSMQMLPCLEMLVWRILHVWFTVGCNGRKDMLQDDGNRGRERQDAVEGDGSVNVVSNKLHCR